MKYREEISNMMAKRRQEVLEVAFTLFAERTIEKVSVNDIASATGIGVATIFRYFGTKLSLCVELGALKWNQFAKEIRRNYEEQNCVKKTAYGEFCFFIDSYLLLYKKHPAGCALVFPERSSHDYSQWREQSAGKSSVGNGILESM